MNTSFSTDKKLQSNEDYKLNDLPKYEHTNEILNGDNRNDKSEEHQSTSDNNKSENTSKNSDEKSKNILNSIKSFFKF